MDRVTSRTITPSRSSCRRCSVNTFSEIFGNFFRSSANRNRPNERCQKICTFHFPASTAIVACTGQPFMCFICTDLFPPSNAIFAPLGLTFLCVLPRLLPSLYHELVTGRPTHGSDSFAAAIQYLGRKGKS